MAHTLCTAASFQLAIANCQLPISRPEAIGCVARYGAIMMNNPAVIDTNSSVRKTTSAVGDSLMLWCGCRLRAMTS